MDNKKPAKSYNLRVFKLLRITLDAYLVPMTGFEPARLASPPPQDGVSTISPHRLNNLILHFQPLSLQELQQKRVLQVLCLVHLVEL